MYLILLDKNISNMRNNSKNHELEYESEIA